MSVFRIIVIPAGRHGRFTAFHGANGARICCSRQPLLDSARILLSRGHPPTDTIAMRHHGSAHDAMTATLGDAAKWTVQEDRKFGPRFVRWKAFSRSTVSAPVRLNASPALTPTPEAETPALEALP